MKAYTVQEVTEVKRSMLRCGALESVAAETAIGRLHVCNEDDIRYFDGCAQIRVWGEWIDVLRPDFWAAQEGLVFSESGEEKHE